jgi:hypothetical protein
MCGLLGYVVSPDTLYVFDDNSDLVVIQHEHSNVYLPGVGQIVLNPAALRPTTPEAGSWNIIGNALIHFCCVSSYPYLPLQYGWEIESLLQMVN